ncbi:Uncharacterized protein Rs2_09260 [Raphanus sativus]|nr:Uncharacterized protein Rs2_09260 [Raphanus sativus]
MVYSTIYLRDDSLDWAFFMSFRLRFSLWNRYRTNLFTAVLKFDPRCNHDFSFIVSFSLQGGASPNYKKSKTESMNGNLRGGSETESSSSLQSNSLRRPGSAPEGSDKQ